MGKWSGHSRHPDHDNEYGWWRVPGWSRVPQCWRGGTWPESPEVAAELERTELPFHMLEQQTTAALLFMSDATKARRGRRPRRPPPPPPKDDDIPGNDH